MNLRYLDDATPEKEFSPTFENGDRFEDYFDPREFYNDELPSWQEHWNDDVSTYHNLINLTRRLVVLPNQSLYLPIAVTYLMQPTRPAKCLPVLASIGEPGSGKSTLTFLAVKIRGIDACFSPKDTSSSVRNAVDAMRYYYPGEKRYEKEGAIVCWDNLSIKKLQEDKDVYNLFLVGYNALSATMRISKGDGTNIDFNVFSPKIVSTIDPIHTHPDFAELHRRLWVIPHKKIKHFTASELSMLGSEYDNFLDYKLELEGISWKGFREVFHGFWDRGNCQRYAMFRSFLSKRDTKKTLRIPEILQGEAWDICLDPIATGLCIGTWKSHQEAIDHVEKYLLEVNKHKEIQQGATIDYLNQLIEAESKRCQSEGGDEIVDAGRVKMYLEALAKTGSINETVNPRNIASWMDFIGFNLTTKGWVRK